MIYILIVVLSVHGGSDITFQEFNSLEACKHARSTLYQEDDRISLTGIGLKTAYCVAKGKK